MESSTESVLDDEARELHFPSCDPRLLNCPSCEITASKFDTPVAYSWAYRVICGNCHDNWLVCKLCEGQRQRSHLKVTKTINRHHDWCLAKEKKLKKRKVGMENNANDESGGKSQTEKRIKESIDIPADGSLADDSALMEDIIDGDSVQNSEKSPDAINKTAYTENLRKITLMTEHGIILPVNYKTEDVKEPDWELLLEKNPRMLYFANEYKKKGLGAQNLIFSAIYQEENMPNVLVFDDNDVKLHLKMAQLVNTCTRTQRAHLADIVRLVDDSTTRKLKAQAMEKLNGPSSTNVLIPPLPVSDEDLRREFQSNRYSLLNNLPCPRVSYNSLHDISFANFEDCVEDFLAHGIPFSGLEKSKINKELDKLLAIDPDANAVLSFGKNLGDGFGEVDDSWTEAYECSDKLDSILCQKLYYRVEKEENGGAPCLHLGVDLWFDGFDPNNQSKKNRGSVYIRTVTFAPSKSFRNNLQNTYPLAIGPDKCDRSIIDKHVQEGLKKVSSKNADGRRRTFYCAAIGAEVEVNGLLISKLADQPERRKTLGLAAGNSTYHARFGVIVDLNHVSNYVRPCSVCREKIYKGDRKFDQVRCENCTQWNMDGNHPLLRFKIPENYPPECLSDIEKASELLSPRKISLSRLRISMREAGKRLVDGTWKEPVARSFLRVEGINEEWINKIVKFTRYVKAVNDIDPNLEELTEEEERLAEEQVLAGDGYPMPESWRDNISFIQNIDVPMHLLFLGMVESAVELIIMWCKRKRLYTKLRKKSQGAMKGLEVLGLSWLKILDMRNGKMGGWISENYMAFSRIAPWWYTILEFITADSPYEEPNKIRTSWTKAELQDWLRARELDSSGVVIVLRQRVEGYFNQSGGPPPVPTASGIGIDAIYRLIRSLLRVISLAMTETVTKKHLEELTFCIKHFLTDFEMVDEGVRPKRKKPKWVTTYNIAGLLNILDGMWLMGPLRNFWEGSFQGEGFLRFVKPEINGGLRTLWSVALMNRLCKKKALSCILRETTITDDNEDIDDIDWSLVEDGERMRHLMMDIDLEENDREERAEEINETVDVGEFHNHDYDKFVILWEKHECFSVVVLEDDTLRLVIDNGMNWLDIFVKPGTTSQKKNGMTYDNFDYRPEGTAPAEHNRIRYGCAMLPLLGSKKRRTNEKAYTIIRSDWRVWNGEGFDYISL